MQDRVTEIVGQSPNDDLYVLFEEARRRRRRRWTAGFAGALVVLGVAAVIVAMTSGPPPARAVKKARPTVHPTPTTSPTPSPTPAPTVLNRPEALALTLSGNLLVSNQGSNQILKLEANGALTVVAGTGQVGFGGDGGPATAAQLNDPNGLAVSGDGTIFVADTGNNRIREINTDGVITTVAAINDPLGIAIGPSNTIYVVNSSTIYSIGPTGSVSTLAQGNVPLVDAVPGPDVGPGNTTYLWPSAIAVSSSGELYIADFGMKSLLQDSGGVFRIVGQPAAAQQTYVTQAGLATAPDGGIVVGDYGGFSIDRANGTTLDKITTFSLNGLPGIGGVFRPSGVAVAGDGEIYADTDGANGGSNRPAIVAIDPDGQVRVLASGPITTIPGNP